MATPTNPGTAHKYQKEIDEAVGLLPSEILANPPQWLCAVLLLWECGVPYGAFNQRTFMP